MVTKLAPGVFFGRVRHCRTVAGISLTESIYGPEVIIPPHEHASAYFDFVLEGFCREVVNGQTRQRGPGSLAFHPAGEAHTNCWHDSEARCFHIAVGSAILDRLRAYSPTLDQPVCFPEVPARWLMQRAYDEFRCTDDVSALALEGLTLELLAECARGRTPGGSHPPRWLRQVRDLLHEAFRQRLTLDGIAGSVGVHPAHLARVFRQLHGCTVGEYVRSLRIQYARHCLMTSDTALATIALAAGFSDQSHFSRVFKRETGMSPAVFKESVASRKSNAKEYSDHARR
jgi:AraC family transcriptional regulator